MKNLLLSLLFVPALLSAAEELGSSEFGGYRNFHLRIAREFERELKLKYPELNGGFLSDRLTFVRGRQPFSSNGRETKNEAVEDYLSWNPDQKDDEYALQLVATFEAIGIPFSSIKGTRLEGDFFTLKATNTKENLKKIEELLHSEEYPTIEYAIIDEKWHRVWHGAIRECYKEFVISCYPFLSSPEFQCDFSFSVTEGPSIYKSPPKGANPFSKRTPDHYKDYLLRYLESNEDQTERTELLQQLLLLRDMGIQFEYGTKARYEPKLNKVIMTNTKQAHARFSDLFRNYLKPVTAEPVASGQRR